MLRDFSDLWRKGKGDIATGESVRELRPSLHQ